MYLKLAWRNLWRNKRRTFITMGSVFFAVILCTLMMGIKEGAYANMIKNLVADFTGYAQVHSVDYWDDKTIDNSLQPTSSLIELLDQTSDLNNYTFRIESFALSASDSMTRGAMVVGVETEKEKDLTGLHQRVSKGNYLLPNEKGALLGEGLAEYLGLDVGDTVVLLGQGYRGRSAAGAYPVTGLVKYGSPQYSKQLVFLPLAYADTLYGTEGTLTNIVLHPNSRDKAEAVVNSINANTSGDYRAMTWQEMSPNLLKMIETDRVEGYVFMFILYMVIAFGVFGTTVMMLAERRHEFGVLVAVGMKRIKLGIVVFLEILIISLMGAILGIGGAYPVCAYFHYNPIRFGEEISKMTEEYGMEAIIQASIDPAVFVQQGLVVAIIASLIAIYPFIKIVRLDAIKSMRS